MGDSELEELTKKTEGRLGPRMADGVPRSAPGRDVAVVHEDAQVRALSNPERVKILAELVDRPATAKQLAEWLGATRGRVHYHVKELEKAGLVEIVARLENRGAVEKYYRAVARNFYVGRGIGEYGELDGDVRKTVASSVLSWRRERVLEVDQNEIARRIVEDCLATASGDVVVIECGFVHRQIVEPLTKAIQGVGGRPLVAYRPSENEDLLLKWKHDIASLIVVEEPLDYPLGDGSGVLPEDPGEYGEFLRRLVASGGRFLYAGIAGRSLEKPANRKLIESGKRFVYLGYPTPERARVMGLDFRDLHDACWTALDVDYGLLARRCESMKRALESATDARVTSPSGSDLTFSIEGREVYVDDGVISDWEVAHGRGWGQLPAGKVMIAPRPRTAEGIVVSEVTDYFGVRIEGLEIEFE
ncbi:MAG: helix-turn-helix domain-containing protein, partial [Candidatus Eisenbacteria bacterium]|nr:helix-turn-helix domain-containing protein [Candidatus Eisenbacteria bacterium]